MKRLARIVGALLLAASIGAFAQMAQTGGGKPISGVSGTTWDAGTSWDAGVNWD
jgi:hypothetical protein